MRPDVSEEEAIRTIVNEGTCADYVDIADRVRERFGWSVGAGRVEAVVMAIKHEMPGQPVPRLKKADIKLAGDLRHTSEPEAQPQKASGSVSEESTPPAHDVLKFVESMGGFDAARAAITDLEHSLRSLMK